MDTNNRSRIHWNMKWINRKFAVNLKLRGKSPAGQTHYSYQESFPYHKPQNCIGPISIRRRPLYRANIGMLISKWHIQLGFTNVKWNMYPTSEWSTRFNNRIPSPRKHNCIRSIAIKHRRQYRTNIGMPVSKLYKNGIFFVGFIDGEIRYLSDIERLCFSNRTPSYFCRFHIGCYIDLTYSVVDIKTIQKLHFHLGFADTDVRYRWLISSPRWNCMVFIESIKITSIGKC